MGIFLVQKLDCSTADHDPEREVDFQRHEPRKPQLVARPEQPFVNLVESRHGLPPNHLTCAVRSERVQRKCTIRKITERSQVHRLTSKPSSHSPLITGLDAAQH